MTIIPASPRTTTITLASASAGPFDVGFRICDPTLKVYVDRDPRTDFSVSATFVDGFSDDAQITFPSPLPSGSVIVIDGDQPIARPEDYINPDRNLTRNMNIELGRAWAGMQQIKRDSDRSYLILSDFKDDVEDTRENADRAETAAAIADATSGAGIPDIATFIVQNAIGTFDGLENGQVIMADGLRYMREAGATVLPSLPGWVPAPPATLSAYLGDIQAMFRRGGGIVNEDASVSGVLETWPDLRVEFDPGTVIRQTRKSVVGAFLTNVVMGAASNRIQSNIEIRGGIISGEDYPAPVIYEIVASSTTTLTFDSSAPATDDALNGYMLQVMEGTFGSATGSKFISDYDGATRTATVSVAFASAPEIGSDVQVGFNDNAVGFAWGGEHIRIEDGVSRNYPMSKMTPPVLGGKGLNFEQGAKDAVVRGRTFADCYTGLYLNAHLGDHTNGYPKWVQAVRASDLHFENCGSAISAGILDGVAGIPADADRLQAVLTNLTYHNCGHAPLRIAGTQQQKSGVLNLMGANGLNVAHVRGYNDADYVTQAGGYPTDYPARSGYGLSGPIGAVIWGHARATRITDWHHHGDVDKAVHIGRVRALGDDAPPNGVVSELIGWDIDGLYVYGAVSQIVGRDLVTGFNANQIFGHWKIGVNSATQLLDPGLTTGTGWTLELTEIPTGKTVIGTAAQILARGNTFADYPPGTTDLRVADRRVFALADDTAVSFTPLKAQGVMTVSSAANLVSNVVYYEADVTPQCKQAFSNSGSAALTTALTGTTGVDGDVTFSAASDGKVYIENRRGAAITVTLTIPT